MTTTPTTPGDRKPFSSWLLEQASGKTEAELTDGLADLVRRVCDTGKKGTIALTVTVAPLKDDPSILVVTDEIKLKLPEHDRKASMFWPDADGQLLRSDPNQRSIFDEITHQNVDTQTGEVQS